MSLARTVRRLVAIATTAATITVLAGCGGSTPGAAQPRATTSTAPGCTTARTSGPGTLAYDGTDRTYLLELPDPSPRDPAPLVVALHGHGGSAVELEAHTRLAARGAAGGAVVVTPDALGSPARWNFDRRDSEANDFGFIGALIDHLEDELCIDPDRVSVVGSSNGAAFAGLLACDPPYRFAAVAMVIATVPSSCPDDVSPAILTIRGTADPHVRFDGTPDLVAGDAARYECDPDPVREHPAASVARTRYRGCRGGTEVVLDAVEGGVHRWPTEDGSPPYDATGAVLAFLADHPGSG